MGWMDRILRALLGEPTERQERAEAAEATLELVRQREEGFRAELKRQREDVESDCERCGRATSGELASVREELDQAKQRLRRLLDIADDIRNGISTAGTEEGPDEPATESGDKQPGLVQCRAAGICRRGCAGKHYDPHEKRGGCHTTYCPTAGLRVECVPVEESPGTEKEPDDVEGEPTLQVTGHIVERIPVEVFDKPTAPPPRHHSQGSCRVFT